MNRLQTIAIAGTSLLMLFATSGCTDSGIDVPKPGQGTGSANASQPVAEPEPERSVGSIETGAPEGGAAAKVGDQESVINRVACTTINGVWSMSGSDEEAGTKVAVTGSEDRKSVQSASIVLADGTVVQVMPGAGEASISWDDDTFTVTGNGEKLNLNDPESTSEIDFVITATCDAS